MINRANGGRLVPALIFIFIAVMAWGCGPKEASGPEPAACSMDGESLASVLGDKSGAVVILDVRTGSEVASYYKDIDPEQTLPIGSLFKLATALFALEHDEVKPDGVFICQGELWVGETRLGCWLNDGHGPVDLPEAIGVSCNIFFYRLGLKLKADDVLERARELGLRQVAASSAQELKAKAVGYSVMGRNISWAAGADPGIKATPYEVAEFIRNLALGAGIDDKALEWVRKGMKLAVEKGTAAELANFYPAVAGKTGTGFDILTQPGVGWFAGYLPADDPVLAFVVVMKPGKGEKDAVPAARKVLELVWENCQDTLKSK